MPRTREAIQDRVRKFTELRMKGFTAIDAYEMVGYSRDDSECHKWAKRHGAEIFDYTKEHLGGYIPLAIGTLVNIMNDPEERGAVKLKAAQDSLDRTGFSATQKVSLEYKDTADLTSSEIEAQIIQLMKPLGVTHEV